ncbi:hypothetical protein IAJ44_004291 [Salmonella enterica]|nr:hypothetical protein [Salmonella enterica subsp. enterica serovar Mississippi]EGD6457230.1 hypothetical protein [Salmonella enterica]
MPVANVATPRFSVRLYKSIMRKQGEAGLAVSERYANKEAFIDLTPFFGDGSAITTSKDTRQPAGTFSLTFSDRPNVSGQSLGPVLSSAGLESVYGLVEPMDVVEIRMWNGRGKAPYPLPIKMRGFVSEITRGRQLGSDGKPMRTVVITGQDYGKILQTYQIVYLTNYPGAPALLTGFDFFEQFGGTVRNTISGAEYLKLVMEKVINPLLGTLIPEFNGMPREIQVDAQTNAMMSNSYNSQQGSVYDLLKGFLDVGIWNELYVEDREEGVFLVWRPVPAFDLQTGNPTQTSTGKIYQGTIPDNDITQMRQGRKDESVFNFYWCTNTNFDMMGDDFLQAQAMQGDLHQPTLTYPNTAKKYYGIRAMYADSVMGPMDVENQNSGLPASEQTARDGSMNQWITARRQVMVSNNKDNVVMEYGNIELKGGPTRDKSTDALKAGDYVLVLDGMLTWQAYVTGFQDNFIPFRSYTSSITFERGSGFAWRVSEASGSSPWLRDQATRITDIARPFKDLL